MVITRRRAVATGGEVRNAEVMIIPATSPPPTDVGSARKKLRQRWELASVLNFLNVFEPVIRSDVKISAEDIETALMEQNSTLAQLHIALLKGILPTSKTLKDPHAWMIAVSKTLSTLWPWVSNEDFPLTGDKGEVISVYKELEPTSRLLILKALCEVRADQHDAVSFINKAIKNGTDIFYFQKKKFAGDGSGISFWYDGNDSLGFRLYKEVILVENERVRGKVTMPAINFEWETLATNLEEFNKIANEFASSEIKWEVALSNSITVDVIPVLEKQLKKKLRAQHRQQRKEMLLYGFRNSRITRSCRNQKHVDYRFDDYDRSIKEAIQYANKRKTNEEQRQEENQICSRKRKETNLNESYNSAITLGNAESTQRDADRSSHHGSNFIDDSGHEEYDGEKEDDGQDFNRGQVKVNSKKQRKVLVNRSKELRFSKRLAGIPSHVVPESMNLGAKNRLRQRPYVNTAIESEVVPDSEDERSSGDLSINLSGK